MNAYVSFAFPSRRPIWTPVRWVDLPLSNQEPCMRVRVEEPAIISRFIPNRVVLPSDHTTLLTPAENEPIHQVSSHEMLITTRRSESYMGQVVRIQRKTHMFDYALRIEIRFLVHYERPIARFGQLI